MVHSIVYFVTDSSSRTTFNKGVLSLVTVTFLDRQTLCAPPSNKNTKAHTKNVW